MDLNLVVVGGRLAASPEIVMTDDGVPLVRLLIVARTDHPARRIDVLPVLVFDNAAEAVRMVPGQRIWVCGSIQRRFSIGVGGRRSRLEIVASSVRALTLDGPKLSGVDR